MPAFIPIDMSPPKHGMRGAVDWRRAGVAAGIGGYGESGLLVTEAIGPAVRLGGIVTDAEGAPHRPIVPRPVAELHDGELLLLLRLPGGLPGGEGDPGLRPCHVIPPGHRLV